MERLTEKTGTGYERKDIQVKNQQLIDNLAAYEDAEDRDCSCGCHARWGISYILHITTE